MLWQYHTSKIETNKLPLYFFPIHAITRNYFVHYHYTYIGIHIHIFTLSTKHVTLHGYEMFFLLYFFKRKRLYTQLRIYVSTYVHVCVNVVSRIQCTRSDVMMMGFASL